MGKFTIKALAFLLVIFVMAGCSEDSTTTNAGKSFVVNLVEDTVADTEGSYFLITVDGAEEIDNATVDRIEGESEETYNSRLAKAVSDAKSRGLYINVASTLLNATTVVLNKDNGTLTDAGKSVLILVKKDDTPQADGNESANSYQIQILLDARKAVLSEFVNIQVGNQKLLFSDFYLQKPRIFTDLNGKEIAVIDIPQDDLSDKDNQKIGTNIILDVADVNVYGYDSVKKEAVGPLKVDYGIKLAANAIEPFKLADYRQGGEIPGCLSDGSKKCGLNISGWFNLERNFVLSFTNNINDSESITTEASLLVRGTMPKEYTVTPYRTKYLDNTTISSQPSVAIFDVEAAMEGRVLQLQDISVMGKCGDTGFQLLTPSDNNIGKCQYVVKEIEANKNFRIFVSAVEASYAAANDGLNIKIKDDDNTFTGSDISASNISFGEKNGGVLDTYKLAVHQKTMINVKLNFFGPEPAVFSYNNSGSKDNKWTTETLFTPVLSNHTYNGNISFTILNYNVCKNNSNAVDCEVEVTASNTIGISNPAALTFSYTAGTESSVLLPNTVINFYTAD